MTGEKCGVLPWLLSSPASLTLALFFACLRHATGIDLLTAFGVLVTVVAYVSLLLH